MAALPLALQVALGALALLAAAFDFKNRRIPNWLTASGLAGGLVLQTGLRRIAGLREAVFGASLAFGIYFVLFALRAMGAGDVKLMTAVGAIAGPSNWLIIFVAGAIAGGVLAVIAVLSRGTLLRTILRVRIVLSHLVRGKLPYEIDPRLDIAHPKALTLPHAVPIAIGCMSYLVIAAGRH